MFTYPRDISTEAGLRKLLAEAKFQRISSIRPICLLSVDSTQTFLADSLRSSTEGDMVISKIQTNGKGRGTHSWLSETGGLWLSITLTPPADLVDELQLVGAQSVVKAFSDLDPCFETWVKEPNDVMIGTKKIAGCLVSAVLTGNSCIAYLGLGVNLNNSMKHSFELQGIATTYRDETGRIVDLVEFAFLFLTNFDQNYFKLANKRATPVTRETL